MKNLYLTANEEKAVKLLADGRSSGFILEQCEIPVSGLGTFTAELRRKTGIEDTRSPSDCKSYLNRYAKAFEVPPKLSREQEEATRIILKGNSMTAVAYRVGGAFESAVTLIDSIFSTAGIFSKDPRTQRAQLRLFMAVFHLRKNICEDIGPKAWEILRASARGEHYTDLALKHHLTEEQVCTMAHNGLMMLGFVTRGRGTKENLLRAYMEYLDEQIAQEAVDPMNDPLL
jgi:hypothetical protein